MYATWTPKSRLFANHERMSASLESVAARRENFTDKQQYEIEDFETDDTTLLPSVLEAKRQNALFKQRELERLQHELNDINSRLRVERDHYQQWARSPIKRTNNSVLYRGIQQLKARVVKDEHEKPPDKKVSFTQCGFTKDEENRVTDQMVPHTQNVSQYQSISQPQQLSQPHSSILRRQRTSDSGFSRYSSYGRSPLKVPNAVVHVLSERSDEYDNSYSNERKIGSSKSLDQSQGKGRFGTTRHRERFPLSVNTPKCFDDTALVVNQPIRSSDPYRQRSKLELKERDSRLNKSDYRLKSLESTKNPHETENETVFQGQRSSSSYFGSFAPRKLMATIRIAELYDFSKHSHSAELKYLERQLTDPNIMMKGSKVIKWVPHLQRTREKN